MKNEKILQLEKEKKKSLLDMGTFFVFGLTALFYLYKVANIRTIKLNCFHHCE